MHGLRQLADRIHIAFLVPRVPVQEIRHPPYYDLMSDSKPNLTVGIIEAMGCLLTYKALQLLHRQKHPEPSRRVAGACIPGPQDHYA